MAAYDYEQCRKCNYNDLGYCYNEHYCEIKDGKVLDRKYHFRDDTEMLVVGYSLDDMIKGLRFKAEHIKAKVEPEFFEAVAHRLSEILTYEEKLHRAVG